MARHPAIVPPWIEDPESAHCWVILSYAAKHWFRRSTNRLKACIKQGDFEGIFDTFYDGRRWYIKLPYPKDNPSIGT